MHAYALPSRFPAPSKRTCRSAIRGTSACLSRDPAFTRRREFTRTAGRSSAYDESDDEDGPGPGRVQCAQQ